MNDTALTIGLNDKIKELEAALTEFCGHNDETRGGWALQSLSRAIDLIAVKQTGKEGE